MAIYPLSFKFLCTFLITCRILNCLYLHQADFRCHCRKYPLTYNLLLVFTALTRFVKTPLYVYRINSHFSRILPKFCIALKLYSFLKLTASWRRLSYLSSMCFVSINTWLVYPFRSYKPDNWRSLESCKNLFASFLVLSM